MYAMYEHLTEHECMHENLTSRLYSMCCMKTVLLCYIGCMKTFPLRYDMNYELHI